MVRGYICSVHVLKPPIHSKNTHPGSRLALAEPACAFLIGGGALAVWTCSCRVLSMALYRENTRIKSRLLRLDPYRRQLMQAQLWKCTAASVALIAGITTAQAQSLSGDALRIGVLTDISGTYADVSGRGAVEAVRMAVVDFGCTMFGKPIEVLFADHLNKPDIGAARARKWFDREGFDMITDLANSGVALAVAGIAKEKKRHIIVNNPSNMGLTNDKCSPYTVHYTYDAYSLAHGTGRAVAEQPGGDTWYFLTVDFAFGIGLEEQVSEVVRAANGKVLGAARHPLGTTDYSSYILQAQTSGAKIIGLASTGHDSINAIKAAHEFGLTPKQKLAGLLLWINDIHAIGIDVAQGMLLTNAWYWDMNEGSRDFAKRYYERMQSMPNMAHAG